MAHNEAYRRRRERDKIDARAIGKVIGDEIEVKVGVSLILLVDITTPMHNPNDLKQCFDVLQDKILKGVIW